ncbi:MAG: protein phosphatase 2C domain-containing protein [Rhabdochlamydiaceae bacterium]|nr:protein phosphatase 2C domain-containing protein [Rhabdochlamydiaceae bacterium]
MEYNIESFGMSDQGLVRQNNEDVFEALIEKNFFALADGMGGHNAGEIAASLAIQFVCQKINEADLSLSAEEMGQYLRQALAQANAHIWGHSLQDPHYLGMGTTLCCFMIHDESLIYAHVGDSRLYRFRGNLELITRDHSLRASLEDKGEVENGKGLPYKHVITRALGTTSHVMPDIGILSILPNDIYFLCSDGLSDMVPDSTIEAILKVAPKISLAVPVLIQAALEKGGNDNITVLMVKINN